MVMLSHVGVIMMFTQSSNTTFSHTLFLYSLTISDPPKFAPLPSSKAVGVEDESMVISLLASGNPTNIQYTWTKEGAPFEDHGMCLALCVCVYVYLFFPRCDSTADVEFLIQFLINKC